MLYLLEISNKNDIFSLKKKKFAYHQVLLQLFINLHNRPHFMKLGVT
jgi:hypothetical protein